jgi:hypothetical protein
MRRQTMVVDSPITPAQPLEQRQAQRHPLTQLAKVSVLGTDGQTQGEIRNVSKGGTQLQLNQPLRPGSLLRIEYDNHLLLGEVVYCSQEQSGWVMGIRVEHSLSGLKALSDAMRGPW